MIDAFYQSLICFFIPYFVSLVLISISSSSLSNSELTSLSHHFPSPLCRLLLLFPSLRVLPPQAYADSDVDLFTWGTPITTLALFTILLHLGIETKTWVRSLIIDLLMTIENNLSFPFCCCFLSHSNQCPGFRAHGCLTPAD